MMMVKVAMMRNLDMLNEHETRRTNPTSLTACAHGHAVPRIGEGATRRRDASALPPAERRSAGNDWRAGTAAVCQVLLAADGGRLRQLRHITYGKGELEFATRRRREAVLRRLARAPPLAG